MSVLNVNNYKKNPSVLYDMTKKIKLYKYGFGIKVTD